MFLVIFTLLHDDGKGNDGVYVGDDDDHSGVNMYSMVI